MFKRNAMGNTRTKLVAGAVLLTLGLTAAGSAMSTDTFGGGATLPAGAYVGFDFLSGGQKQSANTSVNATGAATVSGGSLFGAWAAASSNKVSYCQTGSGNGKKIFDNSDGTNHLTAVGACDGTTAGFNAPAGVLVNPHFAGSDAPMSTTEYSWFNTGGKTATYGEPTQFPAVAGSIAIIYNNGDVTTQLNLTDAQICSVFNGTTTNWSAFGFPSKPIKVAFRSDGSGTTFSLANHLATVCSGTASQHFVVDQAFSTVISKFPALSGSIGASGNPAVVTAVNSNDGAIGYAESANLKAAASLNPNVKASKVNGFDPYSDFPVAGGVPVGTSPNTGGNTTANSINVATSNDRAITGVDATTGRPTLGALTPLGQTGCMKIVDPANYANSTTRYPIVAVSYLIANNKGNGTDAAAVQGLIGSAYAPSAGVTSIGQGTGFAFVKPVPAIAQSAINACVNI
ncbi:MAG: Alkaline phosphatase L [Luteibacter sp.]|uniref:PstS family phosphate ABC transporter substrate-binding protein n=1 Tax=Luteibacter sp. TaxID=1886636 RepID=UPI00138540DC|nr:substrate-binding domain-containing protein [Luteibacter sp.]KAF1009116.1 MAG: Alkaline phosphatase L [Luteibacter sp.]